MMAKPQRFNLKTLIAALAFGAVQLLDTCLPFTANVAQAAPLIWKRQNPISVALFVNASVNGHDRLFTLDTGLNQTMLAPDEQSKKFAARGQTGLISSAGQPQACDLVKIEALKLDTQKISNDIAQRCDFGAKSSNTLGMSSLSNQVLSLKFSSAEFSVQSKISVTSGMQTMTRSLQGHMKLPVTVAGEKTAALFDTGWSITAVDSKLITAHPEAFERLQAGGTMGDLTGRSTEVVFYKVKSFKVGEIDLNNQIVEAYDFPQAITDVLGKDLRVIIGTNTMILADWIFDLKANRWSLTARAAAPPAIPAALAAI